MVNTLNLLKGCCWRTGRRSERRFCRFYATCVDEYDTVLQVGSRSYSFKPSPVEEKLFVGRVSNKGYGATTTHSAVSCGRELVLLHPECLDNGARNIHYSARVCNASGKLPSRTVEDGTLVVRVRNLHVLRWPLYAQKWVL